MGAEGLWDGINDLDCDLNDGHRVKLYKRLLPRCTLE